MTNGTFLSCLSRNEFFKTCAEWIQGSQEVLVASHYGAGDRDYLFCRSLDDLQRFCESTAQGYSSASVAAFRTHQMQLRGVVDQAFIDKLKTTLPEFKEYLVLQLAPNKAGLLTGNACDTIAELLNELHDELGRPVAVGEFPEWNSFSTLPPEEAGYICTTIDKQ